MAKRRTSPATIRRTFTTRGPSSARPAALRGIRALDAERRSQLAQAAKEEAQVARMQRQVAGAQRRLLPPAGADARALKQLAAAHRQQMRRMVRRAATRRTRGHHAPAPPAVEGPQISLLTPPYTWEWSNTWQIDYAPGVLTATADKQTGALEFVDYPDYDASQVARSGGASAVGLYFQPSVDGVLTVVVPAPIHYEWGYSCAWAGANTRGWAGLVVQSFPVHAGRFGHSNAMYTHVYQRNILFDKGDNGTGSMKGDEVDLVDTFEATFGVVHSRWYAIWLWCGGDVHAEGYYGYWWSTASAKIDVHMPYVILDLQAP